MIRHDIQYKFSVCYSTSCSSCEEEVYIRYQVWHYGVVMYSASKSNSDSDCSSIQWNIGVYHDKSESNRLDGTSE